MWNIIQQVVAGIFGPVTQGVVNWLNKKQDVDLEKFKVDGQVDTQALNAHVALLQARASILSMQMATTLGRWMQYGFVFSLMAWWIDIVFYCMAKPYLPWLKPVLALPAPLDNWGGLIMGFLFLASKIDDWKRKT